MGRVRILLTASGGGHTGFAVAVASYIPEDVGIVFTVGSGDTFSWAKIAALGRENVSVVELPYGRKPWGSLVGAVPRLSSAFLLSLARLPKVSSALCTGHNNCVPPCIASRLRGTPLVSLEDVYRLYSRSRSISLLSRFSRYVALHWQEQENLYPRKGLVVGPVYEPPRYESRDDGFILVTAGSFGYEELFDVFADLVVDGLISERVILQTGHVPPEKYKEKGLEAFSFDPDIDKYISRARIVVTHQGMTAINSALGYGKPTVIVYNPAWRLAATAQEVERVARIVGIEFVPGPYRDRLLDALRRASPPDRDRFEVGAMRLARLLLDLATR